MTPPRGAGWKMTWLLSWISCVAGCSGTAGLVDADLAESSCVATKGSSSLLTQPQQVNTADTIAIAKALCEIPVTFMSFGKN